MDGAILIHVHDKQDWRLRRFRSRRMKENHPVDPNWETGRYMRCHEDARDKMKPGLMIFDVVFLDGRRVVRSAFKIRRARRHKSGRILYFSKFWYPTSSVQAALAPPGPPRTRHPQKLGEEEAESLIGEMRAAGYHEYKSGQTPWNINSEDWKYMMEKARNSLGTKHVCR